MSIKLNAPTAIANGKPTPTPIPAAAPVVIPWLACCVDVQVAALAAPVLTLVELVIEVVTVAPLSKRSVDRAAFITALYEPTVKFCLEQLSRLLQAKTLEAHAHTPT